MLIAKKCLIQKCESPECHKGLCEKHYKRQQRYGNVETVNRPKDWGAKSKHPLHRTWVGLHRIHRTDICERWKDFWKFVEDIKEAPPTPSRVYLRRKDSSLEYGPGNWFWYVPDPRTTLSNAEKAEIRKLKRQANRAKHRDNEFRRRYGVSLEWYEKKLEEQNHCCAICGRAETMEINGKPVRLAVDHCHDTSKARGLLCQACNRGLGFFRHNVDLLAKATAYFKRF